MSEPATSVSPPRVLIALIGLVAVGIVAGASCAIAVVTLFGGLQLAGLAGSIGGFLGAFLAPIAGFSLLRRVALGRAIWWTSVGTVLGGLTGLVLGGQMLLLAPLAGFSIAAFRLWTETTELGRRRRRISKGAA